MRGFRRKNGFSALAVFLFVTSLFADRPANEEAFRSEIAPVLEAHCASCHTGNQAGGELSVVTLESLLRGGKRGPAIVPGHSDQSLLIQFVRGQQAPQMPLGGTLPEQTIAKLAAAIDGLQPPAKDKTPKDEHAAWLFQAPARPALPGVARTDWVRNPIDVFVLAKLEAKGMTPAPEAGRRALIRRLYFDLIGLPPPPEEVRDFLADPRSDAYEFLVDRLLADARYGERWGRHWLDLVRYAESDGFAVDVERPTAWRYRDYVIRAFNRDMPYDLFIKEQLAGDEMQDERTKDQDPAELLIALGFLRMGPWEIDANSKKKLRQDFLNEVTKTTGEVFLGLTVGCAQCHDHKYDPVPQRDFYRIQAFFAATAVEDREAPYGKAEDDRRMKRVYRQYDDRNDAATAELERRKEALVLRFREMYSLGAEDEKVKEFLRELNVANNFFKEREDPIFQSDVWHAYLQAKDEQKRLQELLNRYQPIAYAVADVVPPAVPDVPETHLLIAGDLGNEGDVVEPGFLEAVEEKVEPAAIPFRGVSSGRRIALAEWIAGKENPLTARVLVNRLWQQHFGQGLIRTPSDLGKNGDRPSHPELLDWLAVEFMDRGWSIKTMHKLMLTSSAYRQSVAHPDSERYAELDPENRLLWRMNWQRLDAEVLRDSVLTLSGRLSSKRNGPGALVDVPEDVAEGFEFFKWFPSEESEQLRRSVYLFQRRSVVHPFMETFDVANMSESCSRRSQTTVAPQALTLFNGKLTNTEARHFARRIIEDAGQDRAQQVERAFWLALSRSPSDREKRQALALPASGDSNVALERLGVVLFNLNEFLYLE